MAESALTDQAAGLRRMLRPPALRILPVAGGAHREERSIAVAQLAVAVALIGHAVVVLDQSRGEAARALGVQPRWELLHLLQGEKSFAEVAVQAGENLRLVAAARGLAAVAGSGAYGTDLFAAFARLREPAELVIVNVDAPEVAARVLPAEGEVLLVVSPVADSITHAYRQIKQLARLRGLVRYRILIVDAPDAEEGAELLERIAGVAQRFLGVQAAAAAVVPRDPRWHSSAGRKGALVLREPGPAARALQHVAASIAGWRLAEVPLAEALERSPVSRNPVHGLS